MVWVTQSEIPRGEFGKKWGVNTTEYSLLWRHVAKSCTFHHQTKSGVWAKEIWKSRLWTSRLPMYFLAAHHKCKMDLSLCIWYRKVTWHLNYRKETVLAAKTEPQGKVRVKQWEQPGLIAQAGSLPSSSAVPTSPGAQQREQPQSSPAHQLLCTSRRLGSSTRATAVLTDVNLISSGTKIIEFQKSLQQWVGGSQYSFFSAY